MYCHYWRKLKCLLLLSHCIFAGILFYLRLKDLLLWPCRYWWCLRKCDLSSWLWSLNFLGLHWWCHCYAPDGVSMTLPTPIGHPWISLSGAARWYGLKRIHHSTSQHNHQK
jgi:hypothetical protein